MCPSAHPALARAAALGTRFFLGIFWGGRFRVVGGCGAWGMGVASRPGLRLCLKLRRGTPNVSLCTPRIGKGCRPWNPLFFGNFLGWSVSSCWWMWGMGHGSGLPAGVEALPQTPARDTQCVPLHTPHWQGLPPLEPAFFWEFFGVVGFELLVDVGHGAWEWPPGRG